MTTRLLRLIILCSFASTVDARNCLDSVTATTPIARFVISGELATDQKTGLIWQRCPIGYDLDDGGTPTVATDDACTAGDSVLLDWQGALTAAQDFNDAGGIADWRVPNIKELQSIVEYQCVSPAINLALFPDTPLDRPFWSSTVRNGARVVDFLHGEITGFRANRETDFNFVRLVADPAI